MLLLECGEYGHGSGWTAGFGGPFGGTGEVNSGIFGVVGEGGE